ncbi:hypothetical protein T492DRAFT_1143781 [Pavlovales sp. CCMP2436]|nr:hypothetical protein T492DRAFT_1143781 [Pavlovales sp. CCMP2436]
MDGRAGRGKEMSDNLAELAFARIGGEASDEEAEESPLIVGNRPAAARATGGTCLANLSLLTCTVFALASLATLASVAAIVTQRALAGTADHGTLSVAPAPHRHVPHRTALEGSSVLEIVLDEPNASSTPAAAPAVAPQPRSGLLSFAFTSNECAVPSPPLPGCALAVFLQLEKAGGTSFGNWLARQPGYEYRPLVVDTLPRPKRRVAGRRRLQAGAEVAEDAGETFSTEQLRRIRASKAPLSNTAESGGSPGGPGRPASWGVQLEQAARVAQQRRNKAASGAGVSDSSRHDNELVAAEEDTANAWARTREGRGRAKSDRAQSGTLQWSSVVSAIEASPAFLRAHPRLILEVHTRGSLAQVLDGIRRIRKSAHFRNRSCDAFSFTAVREPFTWQLSALHDGYRHFPALRESFVRLLSPDSEYAHPAWHSRTLSRTLSRNFSRPALGAEIGSALDSEQVPLLRLAAEDGRNGQARTFLKYALPPTGVRGTRRTLKSEVRTARTALQKGGKSRDMESGSPAGRRRLEDEGDGQFGGVPGLTPQLFEAALAKLAKVDLVGVTHRLDELAVLLIERLGLQLHTFGVVGSHAVPVAKLHCEHPDWGPAEEVEVRRVAEASELDQLLFRTAAARAERLGDKHAGGAVRLRCVAASLRTLSSAERPALPHFVAAGGEWANRGTDAGGQRAHTCTVVRGAGGG